ncbi:MULTISPECIES: hypothetical protein [Ehrlichia]|uniref:Uncharacterized protein n=1 Tax=Ehrlichia cf. muris str. EmCRT TaxID=1359167 RepID=A0A0F3NGD4_9RICK|nr:MULTISPECIES: hypothetical protein [Ehrlichia]KJV65964.1 hypothetical protein EMUCRT_0149 [Ehrlichia cf. muris str. EmCRT]
MRISPFKIILITFGAIIFLSYIAFVMLVAQKGYVTSMVFFLSSIAFYILSFMFCYAGFKNLNTQRKLSSLHYDKLVSDEMLHISKILDELVDYDISTMKDIIDNINKLNNGLSHNMPYFFFSEFSSTFNRILAGELNHFYDEDLLEDRLCEDFLFFIIAARFICKYPMLHAMYFDEIVEFIQLVSQIDISHKSKTDKLAASEQIKSLIRERIYVFKNYSDWKSSISDACNMKINLIKAFNIDKNVSNLDKVSDKKQVIKTLLSVYSIQYYCAYTPDIIQDIDNICNILEVTRERGVYKVMVNDIYKTDLYEDIIKDNVKKYCLPFCDTQIGAICS